MLESLLELNLEYREISQRRREERGLSFPFEDVGLEIQVLAEIEMGNSGRKSEEDFIVALVIGQVEMGEGGEEREVK